MFRIPLLEDHVLLLTPRWHHLPAATQVAIWLVVCLVPIGLVLWLYRYEMRLVARGTAVLMLLLRLAVLVVLLFMVCLEPTYARVTRQEVPGRVIVAVDVSGSMDVPDPQREPVEKLRLARALKLAGDLCTGEQLDDWIRQHEARQPVEFVRPDEFAGDSERRRQEESQRRKAHDQVCERIDSLTRSQAARQLLSRDGARLLARVGAKHKVELMGFAADVQDVSVDQLDELFKKKKGAADPKKPDGEEARPPARTDLSDLGMPQARALERLSKEEGKVLGILLLTDGQHNAAVSPVGRAADLGRKEVPLYPVALGGVRPPPDIVVNSLTTNPVAFKDVETAVKLRFKVAGLAAQDLSVRVHRPGEEDKPLEQKTIAHDGKDQEYAESLQVRMDREGQQKLVVTVKPMGQGVRETTTENNAQMAVINVADEQSKVLLVDGEARWEFHYLWQALLRDRSMKVDSVVFIQPRIGKVTEAELKRLNNPSLRLPPAPAPDHDPLFDYDCIILGDVAAEQLPLAERKRLERFVADRGGTLVVLAGKRAMPLAFASPEPGADRPDEDEDSLMKMLPVQEPRVAAPLEGFPVTLTAEGRTTDFLRLETDTTAKENDERWEKLPRHFWGVTGKAKPGATVLAYVTGDERGLSPEQKRKREQEQALFARHNYGFGRVFFVGLDSTWRWRYRTGDLYHHRFWSQTIRWAASDKPLVTGNKFLRFGTPQAIFQGGEAVKVVVRFGDEAGALPPNLLARARVLRPEADNKDVPVALVALKRRDAQPRVFEGQVRDLAAGQYHLELVIPEMEDKLEGPPGPDGKPSTLRASFSVMPGESGEMAQLATNWALLKELADKNGAGKVYTAEDASALVDLLVAKATPKVEEHPQRLWDWWVTLVVVLALLSAEWITRKWVGLP